MRKTLLFSAENTVLDSVVHGTRRPAAYTGRTWKTVESRETVLFPGSSFDGLPHPVVLFYLRVADPVIPCISAL